MILRFQALKFLCILLFLLAGATCNASLPYNQSLQITGNNSSPDLSNDSQVTNLIDFVNEAVVYSQRVGKESALKEFSKQNGLFVRDSQYIWAYDFTGVNLAHPFHPEYIGNNKLSLTDSEGFYMIEAMQNAALNGSGFVSYQYENPVTGINEKKIAYVKRVDDSWWLASGIYGENSTIPPIVPELIRNSLKNRVDDAISYVRNVGIEEALNEFNNQSGQFTTNGSYIFAFDMNGTTLAMPFQPEKIGVNQKNLTDINGVSIGGEKLMVAETGGGYWYYVFNNPDADGKSELKVSYICPVDKTWVVGTGIYLPDIPVEFSPDKRLNLASRVHDAAEYLQKHGKDTAIRTFNDPNGTFSDPALFIFAFDREGILLANPYLPGLVGMNRMNDQDPYGKYPVRQLIANAENGGGYTYYFFADPGSDYRIRLKLCYSVMANDNLIIGAGIFTD